MKLTSCIARYIRRCGYAMALTLATGSVLSIAEAKEYSIITSIGSDGKSTDTSFLEDAIVTGKISLRKWCPFRPGNGHNYQMLVWDADNPSFSYNQVTVDHAIRPSIQNVLTQMATGYDAEGNKILGYDAEGAPIIDAAQQDKIVYAPGLESFEGILHGQYTNHEDVPANDNKDNKVTKISYIGARAMAPSPEDYAEDTLKNGKGSGDSGIGTVGSNGQEIIAPTTTAIDVHHNNLTIKNSGFHLAIGAYSQFGNVYRNAIYVQDARFSDDIIAGIANAGHACDNTATIFRAQCIAGTPDPTLGYFAFNNSGKVVGAWTPSSGAYDAKRNKVFIYGSYVFLHVTGASGARNMTDNEVFLSRAVIGEGRAAKADYVDYISGGESLAKTYSGVAANNKVIIDDTYDTYGHVPKEVIDDTQAGSRTATLPDVSLIYTDIKGGVSRRGFGEGGAHNNIVRIIGVTRMGEQPTTLGKLLTTTVEGDIIGGSADNVSRSAQPTDDVEQRLQAASATGNLVELSGVVVRKVNSLNKSLTNKGLIIGGYVGAPHLVAISHEDNTQQMQAPGNANNNTVSVTASTVENSIYGGYNEGAGQASGNELHLEQVNTQNAHLTFYGGWINTYAEGGRTNNNNVYLYKSGWSMDNTFLHGGWGNEVKTANGILLGKNGTPLVENAVTFDGNTFRDQAGSAVARFIGSQLLYGRNDVSVLGNTTTISAFDGTSFYDANGNKVATIGQRGDLYNMAGNRIAIGLAARHVINADGSISFFSAGNDTDEPDATLTNARVVKLDTMGNETDTITTLNNKTGQDGFVAQQPEARELFELIGGYNEYDTYTRNNWLHLHGYQGKLKGFDHFEKLSFVFTPEVDRTRPMLTITGAKEDTRLSVVREPGAAPTPIEVKVDIAQIADSLKPGDILPVIGHENNEKIEDMEDIPKKVVDDSKKHRQGVTRTVQLNTEFKEWRGGSFDNFGIIEILGRKDEVTPEAKALVEGRIATLTLNNMGGNLVAEQGMDSAVRALEGGSPADAHTYIPVAQDAKGSPIYAPKDELDPGNRLFFVMNGAHNKVDSGSDVDVDGTNALVGVTRGFLAKRALTLGAFMETGWGKYHTHNHFGTDASTPCVRGTGETSYVGAGALLRYRLEHLNRKLEGFSVDTSIRAGRQETDYASADLVDDYGNFAHYEHESDYLAGHVGVNYNIKPADKLTATFYARYLWTRISSDEAIVCGERVSFEDMYSHRIRLGSRLAWQVTENWLPYVGAAFEWEFSGTARANTYGMGITAPSMRGGSVIGEIGTVWQPNITRALWFEAALQGSAGKNENYGAKFGVSIGF